MKEAIVTTEIIKSLHDAGLWAYKIPDAPITKEVLKVTRFTAAKPCDIVAHYAGRFVAIEVKQIRKMQSFSIKHMRPAQVLHLDSISKKGGRAFIFLNIRLPVPRTNHLLILDWAEWGDRLRGESLKSVDIKTTMGKLDENNSIKASNNKFDLRVWAWNL